MCHLLFYFYYHFYGDTIILFTIFASFSIGDGRLWKERGPKLVPVGLQENLDMTEIKK